MASTKALHPYNGDLPYIFVSYACKNADEAMNIIRRLQINSYRIWFDEEASTAIDQKGTILDRIENCSCFIALISPDYLDSSSCLNQLRYARKMEKPILLIHLSKLDLPSEIDKAKNFNQKPVLYKFDFSDENLFYWALQEFQEVEMCKSRQDFLRMKISPYSYSRQSISERHSGKRFKRKGPLSKRKKRDYEITKTKKQKKAKSIKKINKKNSGKENRKTSIKPSKKRTLDILKKKNVPNISEVKFSATVPMTVKKGEYALINIIMYEEEYRSEVDRYLNSGEKLKEIRSGIFKISINSEVRIELSSPNLNIGDNIEEGEWNGGYLNFSFFINIPDNYPGKQIPFVATVYINDLKATSLKFIVKCESDETQQLTLTREDILSAFVSYASQDRSRVAAIIQGMQKARPDLDLFFDVDSLRSGQNWEKALWREIDRRDMLYLCWSNNAKASEWVDREWHYALKHKGLEKIEPIPLDPPDQCPPPKELAKKHFNDRMLYFIQASKDFKS